jgi:alginate production protein
VLRAAWWSALTIAAAAEVAAGAPAADGETALDARPSPAQPERRWFVGVAPRIAPARANPAPATAPDLSGEGRAADRPSAWQTAQFQLPPPEPDQRDRPPRPITQQLTYQYSYGSESAVIARRNVDLDKSVRDNLLMIVPQINGLFVYRPTNWLLFTVEAFAEVEIPAKQPETILLPNGEVVSDQPTKTSLQLDQGYVTVRGITAPFEFNVGRRNYEDERHWIYDTPLDVGSITFRQGPLRIEGFAGREVYKNVNIWPNQFQVKDRINTSMLYVDYRGIEDHRLAAYTMRRKDLTRQAGQPRLSGVRAMGRPTDDFNYWAELAYLGGQDAANNRFAGTGFDVGFTYRFTGVTLNPNFTIGYAYGSGDGNPNDTKNTTFHQSGLESNESRFAGIAKFKYYGEVLDPQLSNLKILTLGVGAYPASTMSVDLVYHKYRLAKLAEELPNSAITAQMNQIDIAIPSADPDADPILIPVRSRDVGQGLDVIVGMRQLFGIRRLGLDLRFGWFFPGAAFRRNDGTEENPQLRNADKSIAFIAKFWW